MVIKVHKAAIEDSEEVSSILLEAALWLKERGDPLWSEDEIRADRIAPDVANGLYFLGGGIGQNVATVKFQLDDPLFWPDSPPGQAAFIHKLSVRRCAAGGPTATSMLQWAVERARLMGRSYLRLDCDADRPKLRAVYERSGFRHHSDRQIGPYFVARYEYRVLI